MSAWREVTLGDVVTLQRGFDLTEKLSTPGSVPVISSGGSNYTTNVAKVDGPGVVTGRKGVLGKVHWSEGAFWPHDTTLWVKDFKRSVPRFVYYLLQTLPLAQLDVGAANPTLNRHHAHLLPIRVPDRETQLAIATALRSFDDLIENNRRRVEVLEEMARAIYREWFVKFRYPGYEDVPLVASSLGLIPQGWAVGQVESLLVLQRGFDLPLHNREAGCIPVIGASGVQGSHSISKSGGPGITTGRSGTVGVVTYVPHAFWPLNTSLWVKEFRLATPRFAYFLLSELGLKRLASGAAVPSLDRNVVHALPTVQPPADLIYEWDSAVLPMFETIEAIRNHSNRVTAIRDLLLPKLVSGQIDVSTLDLEVLL